MTPKEGWREGDPDTPLPGPDMMLGLWASWLKSGSGGPSVWTDPNQDWWRISPGAAFDDLLADGARRLSELAAQDPTLRAIDRMWNANPLREVVPIDWAEIVRALRTVWLQSLGRPAAVVESTMKLNARMWESAIQIWNEAGKRWSGGVDRTGEANTRPTDKRFAAPDWHENPIYRTLQEAYLLASDWLLEQGAQTNLDPAEKQRVDFHLRQFVDATSPTLLLISNPAALHHAIETGGASVADGVRNLLDDLRNGRLSMVDATAFAPGRNLALTPGKVVHRNRLIELIQYTPATSAVHAIPILIVPPWINKFYILDLQPKNSMVRHLVAQGFTVFMVSWKNPDASMDDIGIEDYLDLGLLAASDVAREIASSETLNVMGYCIGGTLLAMALAWLAVRGDQRFGSATFMVSLQDFSRVGDTAIFLGEPNIDFIEQQMMERGYLDSREMANMFNLLRSNDLIWANVVNNYLLGNKPPAFDLLYWNSDGTRMARAAHSWYLRNTYVENNLIKPGKITLKGEPLDLGRIAQDIYAVGTEKDHIVPWDAAWRITQLTHGKVRFVLASSGHIAGIINPPGGKGTYWVQATDTPMPDPKAWRAAAVPHDGSWWTNWTDWLAERSGPKGQPPAVGSAANPAVGEAPGTYVLER